MNLPPVIELIDKNLIVNDVKEEKSLEGVYQASQKEGQKLCNRL